MRGIFYEQIVSFYEKERDCRNFEKRTERKQDIYEKFRQIGAVADGFVPERSAAASCIAIVTIQEFL